MNENVHIFWKKGPWLFSINFDIILGLPKVIYPKSYIHLKEAALAQLCGQIINALVSGGLACTYIHPVKTWNFKQYSKLNVNMDFLIQFRMYFHHKKNERNNIWIQSWFNILLQSKSIVECGCQKKRSLFRVLNT